MRGAISIAEMRGLEEKAFARGETALSLMERAGMKCARLVESRFGTGNIVLLFCGPGNNGGDGLVCARYLKEGNDVTVVMPAAPKTDAAKTNHARAKEAGVRFIGTDEARRTEADIAVDALLGIGAKPGLQEPIRGACALFNGMKAFKVAIDIPSGMDADTGECDTYAVRPAATICIHAPKTGAIIAGKARTGELWVADIGI